MAKTLTETLNEVGYDAIASDSLFTHGEFWDRPKKERDELFRNLTDEQFDSFWPYISDFSGIDHGGGRKTNLIKADFPPEYFSWQLRENPELRQDLRKNYDILLKGDPFSFTTREGYTPSGGFGSPLIEPGDYLSSDPFLSGGIDIEELNAVLSANIEGWTDPIIPRDESKYDESRTSETILDSLVQSFGLPANFTVLSNEEWDEYAKATGIGDSFVANYIPPREDRKGNIVISDDNVEHFQKNAQRFVGKTLADIIAEITHGMQASTKHTGVGFQFPHISKKGDTYKFEPFDPNKPLDITMFRDEDRYVPEHVAGKLGSYEKKGTMEHEAHSIIQPWLERLLFGHTSSGDVRYPRVKGDDGAWKNIMLNELIDQYGGIQK